MTEKIVIHKKQVFCIFEKIHPILGMRIIKGGYLQDFSNLSLHWGSPYPFFRVFFTLYEHHLIFNMS